MFCFVTWSADGAKDSKDLLRVGNDWKLLRGKDKNSDSASCLLMLIKCSGQNVQQNLVISHYVALRIQMTIGTVSLDWLEAGTN